MRSSSAMKSQDKGGGEGGGGGGGGGGGDGRWEMGGGIQPLIDKFFSHRQMGKHVTSRSPHFIGNLGWLVGEGGLTIVSLLQGIESSSD